MSRMNSTQCLISTIRREGEAVNEMLAATHAERERALTASRTLIRYSANSIRATHRGEYEESRRLIAEADGLRSTLEAGKREHPEVYFGGYVEDALKEFVEAYATLAFAEGSELPTMEELEVGPAVYIHGLAEAVGELRRLVLDRLRTDDTASCEDLLQIMDEVYAVLVTVDYPDAVTRGLRRTTDVMRGVIERTRGDVTMALRQRSLERRLREISDRIQKE